MQRNLPAWFLYCALQGCFNPKEARNRFEGELHSQISTANSSSLKKPRHSKQLCVLPTFGKDTGKPPPTPRGYFVLLRHRINIFPGSKRMAVNRDWQFDPQASPSRSLWGMPGCVKLSLPTLRLGETLIFGQSGNSGGNGASENITNFFKGCSRIFHSIMQQSATKSEFRVKPCVSGVFFQGRNERQHNIADMHQIRQVRAGIFLLLMPDSREQPCPLHHRQFQISIWHFYGNPLRIYEDKLYEPCLF